MVRRAERQHHGRAHEPPDPDGEQQVERARSPPRAAGTRPRRGHRSPRVPSPSATDEARRGWSPPAAPPAMYGELGKAAPSSQAWSCPRSPRCARGAVAHRPRCRSAPALPHRSRRPPPPPGASGSAGARCSAMATSTGRSTATNWLSPMRNRSTLSGSPANSSSTATSKSRIVSWPRSAVSTRPTSDGDAGHEEAEQRGRVSARTARYAAGSVSSGDRPTSERRARRGPSTNSSRRAERLRVGLSAALTELGVERRAVRAQVDAVLVEERRIGGDAPSSRAGGRSGTSGSPRRGSAFTRPSHERGTLTVSHSTRVDIGQRGHGPGDQVGIDRRRCRRGGARRVSPSRPPACIAADDARPRATACARPAASTQRPGTERGQELRRRAQHDRVTRGPRSARPAGRARVVGGAVVGGVVGAAVVAGTVVAGAVVVVPTARPSSTTPTGSCGRTSSPMPSFEHVGTAVDAPMRLSRTRCSSSAPRSCPGRQRSPAGRPAGSARCR